MARIQKCKNYCPTHWIRSPGSVNVVVSLVQDGAAAPLSDDEVVAMVSAANFSGGPEGEFYAVADANNTMQIEVTALPDQGVRACVCVCV